MGAAAADTGSCREGWTSWGAFLGTGAVASKDMVFLTYEEAQRVVQEMGIKTMDEYNKRYKEEEGLPRKPDNVYKG